MIQDKQERLPQAKQIYLYLLWQWLNENYSYYCTLLSASMISIVKMHRGQWVVYMYGNKFNIKSIN